MDVQREFKLRPPREMLITFSALTRDWKMRTAPGGGLDLKRDDVVDFCKAAPDWLTAVKRAVASRRPNGKMHNHQSKVKEADRQRFGTRILEATRWSKPHLYSRSTVEVASAAIPRSKATRMAGFDDLHDLLERIRPAGIGPVTTYDVAVRAGAWAGLVPESLYLHAGVLKGWQALAPVPPYGFKKAWAGVARVERKLWPAEVRGWPADEFEDFLCTYREILPSLRKVGYRNGWE